jgi:hypothetical protein
VVPGIDRKGTIMEGIPACGFDVAKKTNLPAQASSPAGGYTKSDSSEVTDGENLLRRINSLP